MRRSAGFQPLQGRMDASRLTPKVYTSIEHRGKKKKKKEGTNGRTLQPSSPFLSYLRILTVLVNCRDKIYKAMAATAVFAVSSIFIHSRIVHHV